MNNRLVAAFVPLDRMSTIHKGIAPPMDKYILVEVARQTEFTDIDPATFHQIEEYSESSLVETSASFRKRDKTRSTTTSRPWATLQA